MFLWGLHFEKEKNAIINIAKWNLHSSLEVGFLIRKTSDMVQYLLPHICCNMQDTEDKIVFDDIFRARKPPKD